MEIDIDSCPCCSGDMYSDCCQPYHDEVRLPDTPEQLMRSRYSAFCLLKIDYIGATVRGPAQRQFDQKASYEWANSVEFTGLTVLSAEQTADIGFVTFEARFTDKRSQQEDVIREKSLFNKIEQKWYYVKAINDSASSQADIKQGRNDPCHCGSGQKYKKCCYNSAG